MSRAASDPGRAHRPVAVVAAALLPVLAWIGPGCGTDAVGIEACRQIELTRCDVAPVCAGFEGSAPIETEEQVANCRNFYRDHCLLGLENAEAPPGQGDVDACVAAIQRTADCGSPQRSTIGECGVELREGEDATDAPCQVLQDPERLRACAWLEPAPEEEDGAGGAAASTSATSTASGALPTTTTGAGDATTAATTAGSGGGGGAGGGE